MPVDEFYSHRSHDLPERIRRLEDWAATYAGRATNDPAVKQSQSSSVSPSGGSGSTGTGSGTISQVPGPFGVGGPASDGDFEVFGDAYTLFTHSDASTGSNTMGVVLDRGDAASTVALGFEWRQAGVLQWSLRMAPTTQAIQLYDTLNAATLFSADFSVVSRLSFFGVTPYARPTAYTQTFSTAARTIPAYTTDPETVAYTGLDNLQPLTPYAAVADLNALRVAYETLRASYDATVKALNSVIDDLQAYGLFQ